MDLFKKPAFASLATLNPDGSPQVTPVWVDFDGKNIIVNTAKGRVKHRNAEQSPYGGVNASSLERVGVPADLHVFAVPGIPEVATGDDVGRLIADAVARSGRSVTAGDVFVVAQKVVSKAEGALVALADVDP